MAMTKSKHVMKKSNLLISLLLLVWSSTSTCQDEKSLDIKGRWDITMNIDGEQMPSWLEVSKSGHETLIGRFVYAFGSARPIAEVKQTAEGAYTFSIPRQWEPEGQDMEFSFIPDGEGIKGTMVYVDGKTHNWTGVRQPKRAYTSTPSWGEPIKLFNKKDLSGWATDGDVQWMVKDGILVNPEAGVNLTTEETFDDFKLHVEFRYPEGSNSGLYLRGRYEVQIEDGYGHDPSSILFGGIYGFLTPNAMAAKPAGEWQTYDITLIGNRVSIEANGMKIINDQIIPGITGGAIDSHEGEPGPIFLQGDHGPVEFRSIVLTPREN